MSFILSDKSRKKLEGVHPKLIMVVERALSLSEVDFGVSEGVRSLERQKELVAAKKSLTMNSKHLRGHAVDVYAFVDGQVSWKQEYYKQIAKAFKQAAKELDVKIKWGGDFQNFFDGPHFQIEGV